MTRDNGAASGADYAGPDRTPRLRLKPKAPRTGHVDGAWWPHSDNLVTELPDLLAVLSVRLGPIDRVTYNHAEWAAAPDRLLTGGQAVRLIADGLQPGNTLEVRGSGPGRILLLVVPSTSEADAAHTAMMTAAAPSNASTVGDLLAPGTPDTDASDDLARSTFRRRVRKIRP